MRIIPTSQTLLHLALMLRAVSAAQHFKKKASYQVEGEDERLLSSLFDRFFQRGEIKSLQRHFARMDDEVASLQQLLQDVIANSTSENEDQQGEMKSLQRRFAQLDDEVTSLQQLLQDVIANSTSKDKDVQGVINLANCTWTCDETTLNAGDSHTVNLKCDASNNEVVVDHYCAPTSNVTVESAMLTDPSGKLPGNTDSIGHVTQLECRFGAVGAGTGTSCIRCCGGSLFNPDPCSPDPCTDGETCKIQGYGAYLCVQPIANNGELIAAVKGYLSLDTNQIQQVVNTYGPIGEWDVSKLKDFSGAFNVAWNAYADKFFNEDISKWDVSQGKTFHDMFQSSKAFNQPIGNWDVSQGEGDAFDSMFYGAKAFNQPLGNWDVSQATSFWYTFYDAEAFNQPIGNWDVSQVQGQSGMSYMFQRATAFNHPLENWNVSQGTRFNQMFDNAMAFNQNLCAWNDHMNQGDVVTDMFSSSGCGNGTITPAFTNGKFSPLCHTCNSN